MAEERTEQSGEAWKTPTGVALAGAGTGAHLAGRHIEKSVGDARDSARALYDWLGRAHMENASGMDLYRGAADSLDELRSRMSTVAGPIKYVPSRLRGLLGLHQFSRDSLNNMHTEAARALGSVVNPNLPTAAKAIKPEALSAFGDIDALSKLRQLGIKDFDIAQQIDAKAPQFKSLLTDLHTRLAPASSAMDNASSKLIRSGRAAKWLGLATALAGGGLALSRRYDKTAQVDESTGYRPDRALGDALTTAGAVTTAAGLGSAALMPTRKDVAVTFGTADNLGQGHSTPGNTLLKLMQEDPYLSKRYRFHNLALGASAGNRAVNSDLLNKKFLSTIDSGWGATGFKGNYGGPRIGPNMSKQDAYKRLNTIGRVLFDPDPPSAYTGETPRNAFGRLAGKAKKYGLSGDVISFGPRSIFKDSPEAIRMGPAHFGVNPVDFKGKMPREAYIKEMADFLAEGGGNRDEIAKALQGKKIITVSGASRGDEVGIRAKRLHDALRDAGKLDEYAIIGLGAKGRKAQEMIATEGGSKALHNVFFGGMSPGAEAFARRANSGDFHFMGMGGATPPEMVMHGGSQIITDEMAGDLTRHFKPKSNAEFKTVEEYVAKYGPQEGPIKAFHDSHGAWRAGLRSPEGKQRVLINRLKRMQAQGKIKLDPEVLADLESRSGEFKHWMSRLGVKQNGKEYVAQRGLDAVRDMLDRSGVKSVGASGYGTKNDEILKIILGQGSDDAAREAASRALSSEIRSSQRGYLNFIKRHLRRQEMLQRLGRVKRIAGPGAALTAAGLLLSKLTSPSNDAQKTAQDESDRPGVLLPSLMVGSGAVSAHRAGNLIAASKRLEELGKALDSLPNEVKWNPETAAEYLRAYGQESQRALNGIPLLGRASKHVPIHSFMSNPLQASIKAVTGMTMGHRVASKLDRALFEKRLPSPAHYYGYATDPARIQSREMFNSFGGIRANGKLMFKPEYVDEYGLKSMLTAPKGTDIRKRLEPLYQMLYNGKTPEAKSFAREALNNATYYFGHSDTTGAKAYARAGKRIGKVGLLLAALQVGSGLGLLANNKLNK